MIQQLMFSQSALSTRSGHSLWSLLGIKGVAAPFSIHLCMLRHSSTISSANLSHEWLTHSPLTSFPTSFALFLSSSSYYACSQPGYCSQATTPSSKYTELVYFLILRGLMITQPRMPQPLSDFGERLTAPPKDIRHDGGWTDNPTTTLIKSIH